MISQMKVKFCILVFSMLILACNEQSEKLEAKSPPTFAEDLAPLIHEKCVVCHRPKGSAPFSLISYQEVKKHSSDIVEVTHSRYMPPWLPRQSDVLFKDDRLLSESEIQMIKDWVTHGSLAGDLTKAPAPPSWSDEWQLGKPDLILELPKSFTLSAQGEDIFRNFVLPIPITQTRFVSAVEFQSDRSSVIHHAWMTVDKTDSCRQRDEQHSDQIGFPGMDMGYSSPPGGHALGWTPGKLPHQVPPEMAFALEPGDDLVLQLHMLPSGKPEIIQPKVALYFSEQAPSLFPYGLQLTPAHLEIPANDPDYLVERSIVLPVETQLLSIYPHAHYVCKEMHITATFPNEKKITLLNIPDWDFFWQDLYTLQTPITLPARTLLEMRYTYDNSQKNPRNPNSPPQTIREGDRSVDEMGNLWLQLLPTDHRQRDVLEEAVLKNAIQARASFRDLYQLGNLKQKQGKHELAVEVYQAAIKLKPDHPLLHHNQAGSLAALSRVDEAITRMRESIRLDPKSVSAHLNMGHFHVMKKDYASALRSYQRTLELDPSHPVARQNFDKISEALSSHARQKR